MSEPTNEGLPENYDELSPIEQLSAILKSCNAVVTFDAERSIVSKQKLEIERLKEKKREAGKPGKAASSAKAQAHSRKRTKRLT